MLADRQSRGRLKKDSELSSGITLNLEPLTLIHPNSIKMGCKGRGLFRVDFGQFIFNIRGAFNKRGKGLLFF